MQPCDADEECLDAAPGGAHRSLHVQVELRGALDDEAQHLVNQVFTGVETQLRFYA